MTEEEWDALCNQCGRCCFEKIEDDHGAIFYTMTPCRYLDVVTRECLVYENRFAVNSECMKLTPELVESLKWLPRDCGYRAGTSAAGAPRRKNRRGKGKRG